MYSTVLRGCVIRSFSPADLEDAISLYPQLSDLDCKEWVADTNNVMLREGDSTGIFAYEYPGLYTGHYFFRTKGGATISLANKMLGWMFDNGAEAIRGLTKTDNLPALRVTRHLGFNSCGLTITENGEHEIFVMVKDEFRKRND
jgi:RimJ/RimL family protein N-acetyltransferase